MVDPAPAVPPPAPRRVVVVLGMHRSGTSAVAGCLHRLGVDFGPRLMPATEDNPRGYFEHVDFVNLHDRLLLALGRAWDDTSPFPPGWWQGDALADRFCAEAVRLVQRDFADTPLWGFKDPRLCRLLPWWRLRWRELGCEPRFVIVRRPPLEVAASLGKREGFSAAKSHLLWLQHVLDAERETRGCPRVVIDFKAFVADWQTALEPVRGLLGQLWPNPPAAVEAAESRFVDPGLLRSTLDEDTMAQAPLWLRQADAALRLGVGGREGEMQSALDEVATHLQTAEKLFVQLPAQAVADLHHQLEAARRQAAWYEAEWQKAHAVLIAKKLEITKLRNRVITGDNNVHK